MTAPDPENLRRQFRLPAEDEIFLDGLGLLWEAVIVAGQHWVVVYGEKVPHGYNSAGVDVAILMAPGYPPGFLDMAYFLPPLVCANETVPQR